MTEYKTEYITKEQALEIVKRTSGDYATAFSEIRVIPPADVIPVVHATTSGEYLEEMYCSWKTCGNCKGDNQSVAKYCNWCGARLDGDQQ